MSSKLDYPITLKVLRELRYVWSEQRREITQLFFSSSEITQFILVYREGILHGHVSKLISKFLIMQGREL